MTESSFRSLLLRFTFVPIFSLVVFLTILGIQLHQITLMRAEASRATSLLLQANALLNSIVDEETGIRGFLIARDPWFLQPYTEASARFHGELSGLSRLASTSSSQSQHVVTMVDSFKNFDQINQTLLTRDLSRDAEVDLLKKQKQAMDTMRVELAALISEENSVRETRRTEINGLFTRLPFFGIGGAAIVALLLIGHGVSLFGKIARAFRLQLNETEIQRDSLHTTLESIGDGVMVCDRTGNITMLNPVAEELTGWRKDEAIGEPMAKVFHIVHERTRLVVESPADRVRRLDAIVTLENHTVLIRKDGTEVPIDDSGAPLRNRDGSLSGVVLVFRSVAERRRAASLIRQSH